MKMKALLYDCVDNFGKSYRRIEICPEAMVESCIEKARERSTEIVRVEVYDAEQRGPVVDGNILLDGDSRVFVVINTTEYNQDGRWRVQTARFGELKNLGFEEDEIEDIDLWPVGCSSNDIPCSGVIVIRIA